MEPLAGKPVLDTINYIPQRDERIPGLGGSLSNEEVLQRHLGTAHVVEVFSNITFWHLASLARAADAADRRARADRRPETTRPRRRRVTGFLDVIGYDTVDADALGSGGRRFQFGTRAFVTPYDTFSDQEGTLPAQRQYSPRSTPDRDWRRKIR